LRSKREAIYGWLFSLPVTLGFVLFVLVPMIASFYLSLTDYNIVSSSKFVGIRNYVNLFTGRDPFFYKSLGVTFYYVALSVPAQLIYAFAVAMLLNRAIRFRALFRSIIYIPCIVPTVAISMIWLWLLNPDLGLVNSMLRTVGLPTSLWLFSEQTVIPSLVIMSLWTTGSIMVIFLAGLQGIPRHLYEAVDIDGGNDIHKLRYITIPMMTPTIFFNLIMGIIGAFQTFSSAYIMTQGGPNNASLFYVFYLYREAFTFLNMGAASAIAWVLFIIIGAFTVVVFKSSDRWVFYEGGR
jgi:multiple sugar transport system permease protein